MNVTLEDMTRKTRPEPTAEQKAAEELVRRAREQGLSLTRPDGLLKQPTKTAGDRAEPGADRAPGPREERPAGRRERAERDPGAGATPA